MPFAHACTYAVRSPSSLPRSWHCSRYFQLPRRPPTTSKRRSSTSQTARTAANDARGASHDAEVKLQLTEDHIARGPSDRQRPQSTRGRVARHREETSAVRVHACRQRHRRRRRHRRPAVGGARTDAHRSGESKGQHRGPATRRDQQRPERPNRGAARPGKQARRAKRPSRRAQHPTRRRRSPTRKPRPPRSRPSTTRKSQRRKRRRAKAELERERAALQAAQPVSASNAEPQRGSDRGEPNGRRWIVHVPGVRRHVHATTTADRPAIPASTCSSRSARRRSR